MNDGDDGDACEGRWTDRTSTRGVRGWCGARRANRSDDARRGGFGGEARRGGRGGGRVVLRLERTTGRGRCGRPSRDDERRDDGETGWIR